jgi:hypothetical protein
MKTSLYAVIITIIFGMFDVAIAAHIGNRKVIQIRNYSPSYVRVRLDGQISNPGCATVLNHIIINGIDSKWGDQRLSMLITAMAAGYSVNPNCTTQCMDQWDGKLLVCTEVSIAK